MQLNVLKKLVFCSCGALKSTLLFNLFWNCSNKFVSILLALLLLSWLLPYYNDFFK
jgi:hypothetical protein